MAACTHFFHQKIRKQFILELHNAPWESISAILALGGSSTLYLAMASLPATIVSSIGALQPLVVLFFERIVNARGGNISKDNLLLPKLSSIVLIVIGIVLLSLSQSSSS